MSDSLYDDYVFDLPVKEESLEAEAHELAIDHSRVQKALRDLEDDRSRTGEALEREEVDRAAARHGLSILEVAALGRLAEDANLLEAAGESIARLETDRESFERSGESIDALQTYISDLDRFPLLKASDEIVLARTIETGRRAETALSAATQLPADDIRELGLLVERGRAARDRFIASNLRLVFAHAKARRNQGLDFLDLLQEGALGIIRAVDKFDYRLGYRFSTYATWWVRQSLDRALANHGRTIRLPVHVVERLRKIKAAERRMLRELGRSPTVTEVASATGFDAADVAFLRDASRPVMSLDVPLDSASPGATLGDLIPDPNLDVEATALAAVRYEELGSLLHRLTDRERLVLTLRYGLDDSGVHTLDEVGKEFGCTRERVRQIQNEAERKLKILAVESGFVSAGAA